MSNFFEQKRLITERVKLAEDITLPESIDDYENIKAKFYINIFTPLVDKSETRTEYRSAPSTKIYNNNKLNPSDYQQSNYITLTIPRYILFQFKNNIPKNTEFIITCIGEFKIDHFRIIGVYTLDSEV
jgi:hypothetical protein